MFEQVFKNIDDVLWKEAGCSSERDYTGTWDLSVKNPHAPEEDPVRSPEEILDEIAALDAETAGVLAGIREML